MQRFVFPDPTPRTLPNPVELAAGSGSRQSRAARAAPIGAKRRNSVGKTFLPSRQTQNYCHSHFFFSSNRDLFADSRDSSVDFVCRAADRVSGSFLTQRRGQYFSYAPPLDRVSSPRNASPNLRLELLQAFDIGRLRFANPCSGSAPSVELAADAARYDRGAACQFLDDESPKREGPYPPQTPVRRSNRMSCSRRAMVCLRALTRSDFRFFRKFAPSHGETYRTR